MSDDRNPSRLGDHKSPWRGLIWPALFVLATGCVGPASDVPTDDRPSPPSWLAELPTAVVTAPVDGLVWAVVPELGSEAAKIATYRLAETEAGVVLVDPLGNQFAEVPEVLVHPVSGVSSTELTVGMPVLANRWDVGRIIGRVASVDGEILAISHDWNRATVTGVMDVVAPLPAEAESPVLQWVAYPSAASTAGDATELLKGLCFAEHDGRLWLTDDSGNVEIVAHDAVTVLSDLGRLEPSAGDRVSAYSWGAGFRSGIVAEVLEPGLRYTVSFDDGETGAVFFGDLTQAL